MTRYSIVLVLLIVLVALCVLVRLEKTGATTMAADSPPILLASLPMTPFVLDPLLLAVLSRDVEEDTTEEDPDREEDPSPDVAAITKTYMEEKIEALMELSGRYEVAPETLQREEEQEAVAALVIDTETGAFKNPPIELFPGVRIVSLAPLEKQPLLESAIKRSRGMLKSGEGEGEAEGEGEPDPFATLDLQSDFIAFLSSFFEDYSSGMEDTFDFNAFTVETIDDVEEILPAPNGIPDLAELLVLETFLKTPTLDFSLTGGPSHQSAVNRWQYFETLYGPVSDPSLAPLYRVGLAYSCLDDFMSIYLGAALLSIATEAEVDFANLIDAMETTAYHFSQSGDIDGDQYSALIEWQQYGTGQTFAQAYAAYEAAVLNPAVYPSSITLHTVTRTCDTNVILLYPFQEKVADGVTLTQYATFGYDEALFAYDPYFDHWVITGESPVSPRYSGADTIEVLVEDDVTIQHGILTPDLSVTVSFPDSALEAKVRTAINKPSGTLLLGDVYNAAFTELQATNAGIVSLEGLQHCRFLTSLSLGGNSIVTLTPLSTLYRLNELDLGRNQITDLSNLVNLHDLTQLELGIMFLNYLFNPSLVNNNRPTTLTPLSSLRRIEYLGLSDSGLEEEDLAPLSDLDMLLGISLAHNPGLDLSPLASMNQILMLIDHDSGLTGSVLSGLGNLSSLMFVFLANNNLEDLDALASCTDMQEVYVYNNPDFSVVPNTFPDMRAFGADNCALSDITNLGSLSIVSQLSLSDNDINDITPLLNITAFEENAFINLIDNPLAHTQSCAVITALRARGVEVQENAAQCRHTLTYSAGPHGSIAGTSPQTVYIGGDGTSVEAVPDWGYYFLAWSDDRTDNPRTDTNVTEDITVTAIFAPYQYTLNYLAGDHGSIDGLTPQLVDHGEDGLPVTAVPDYGYHFTDWDDGRINNPRIDTANTEPLTVYASFDINQYNLVYMAGPNGTLEGPTSQQVNHGEDGLPVAAIPDTGYHFTDWDDGFTESYRLDQANTCELTVCAHFDINQYTLSYYTGENGSLTGNLLQTINYGEYGEPVLAVADYGYDFALWSDGVTDNPRIDMNVAENIHATATFVPIDQFVLNYDVGSHGCLEGISPQIVYYNGTGSGVTVIPDLGYHFIQWSDGCTDNPRVDSNVSSDINVSAVYGINQYTLTYLAGPNGTILGTTPQTVDYGMNGSLIIASPNPGYHLTEWSDGWKNITYPHLSLFRRDLDIADDIHATAYFDINQYTLKYTASTGGSISGLTTQVIAENEDGEVVIAIPWKGYHFSQWGDGRTDNPRQDTSVYCSQEVNAFFEYGEPAGVSVPNFLGMTRASAEAIIANRDDLELGEISEVYDYDIPTTYILDQIPPVWTRINEGEVVTVNLVVSLGRESKVYANFTIHENYGVAPHHVRFHDTSSSTVNPVVQRIWSFGDGTDSTDEAPEHTYASPGVYSVSLTVITSGQETDTITIEDAIVVMASESGNIGPAGGSITSAQGASYTVGPNFFSNNVGVHISDTPEACIRQSLSSAIPYQGAVTILPNIAGVTVSENYSATITIPLNMPLSPGTELDVYVRGYSYGQWFFLDEKAVMNTDGVTATLVTNRIGTFIIRIHDEYSIPTLDFDASSEKGLTGTTPLCTAQLLRVPDGGNGPIPIVLIHGQGSYKRGNYGHWDSFIAWAQGPGNSLMSQFQLWWFLHHTDYPIGFNEGQPDAADYRMEGRTSALEFDECLDKARIENGFPLQAQPFIILAHSRGGLVARAWMQNFPDAYCQVIAALTLATPHHGSSLAVPDWNLHTIAKNYGLFTNDIPNNAMELLNGMLVDLEMPGPADLAWNNIDYTNGFGIPYNSFTLTHQTHTVSSNDTGWPFSIDNDNDLKLPEMYMPPKGRGHTLWDMYQDDSVSRFFEKAILYAGFLYDPTSQKEDVVNAGEEFRGVRTGNESGLRVSSSFMASAHNRNFGFNYAANDGMVTLQSALALEHQPLDSEPIYATQQGPPVLLDPIQPVIPLQILNLADRLPVQQDRVRIFADYNHDDMVIGKKENKQLFESIALDLNNAVNEYVPDDACSDVEFSFVDVGTTRYYHRRSTELDDVEIKVCDDYDQFLHYIFWDGEPGRYGCINDYVEGFNMPPNGKEYGLMSANPPLQRKVLGKWYKIDNESYSYISPPDGSLDGPFIGIRGAGRASAEIFDSDMVSIGEYSMGGYDNYYLNRTAKVSCEKSGNSQIRVKVNSDGPQSYIDSFTLAIGPWSQTYSGLISSDQLENIYIEDGMDVHVACSVSRKETTLTKINVAIPPVLRVWDESLHRYIQSGYYEIDGYRTIDQRWEIITRDCVVTYRSFLLESGWTEWEVYELEEGIPELIDCWLEDYIPDFYIDPPKVRTISPNPPCFFMTTKQGASMTVNVYTE